MVSYRTYWPEAARKWDAMARTRMTEARKAAERLFSNKSHYVAVEAKTGVPWYMIACLHLRESDASFSTQLAQGDPLNRVSTHVPKGMGPYLGPDAWDRAAIEALEHDGLTKVIDWRLEKILFYCEKYNGWGYVNKGVPSPYVWAGTNQYKVGKFTSDGHYDANAVDQQLGCAPVLKSLMELDQTIQPVRESDGDADEPIPTPPISTQPSLEIPMGSLATILPLISRYLPLIVSVLPAILQAVHDWDRIKQASPDGVAAAEKAFKDLMAQLSAPQA